MRRALSPPWIPSRGPYEASLLAVAGAGNVRWAAYREGLLRSDDGGTSWKSIDATVGAPGLWAASDRELWMAGTRIGSITDQAPVALHFGVEQPVLFSYFDDREPAGFEAIAKIGTALCAAGDGIVCSKDGGRTFQEQKVRTTERLHALADDGRGGILAVGESGIVLQGPAL